MASLPAGIPLEAPAGLLQQLRRHGQVNLRACESRMPEVNGELIHQPLHIRTLAVPFGQSMDREGVTLMPRAA